MGPRFVDYAGAKIGRLLCLWPVGRKGHTLQWAMQCDCGTVRIGQANNLVETSSCGCLFREMMRARNAKGLPRPITHGHTVGGDSREYRSWMAMKDRCYNTKRWAYQHYGARGITVCPQWRESFATFLADMGPRPEGMSLDRIDNNGNYEPGNCRWATQSEQRANTRQRICHACSECGSPKRPFRHSLCGRCYDRKRER